MNSSCHYWFHHITSTLDSLLIILNMEIGNRAINQYLSIGAVRTEVIPMNLGHVALDLKIEMQYVRVRGGKKKCELIYETAGDVTRFDNIEVIEHL